MTTLLELLIAPALVGLATLAATRFDDGVGGLVSAFPAIVGPTLLIAADQHGGAFAARAATGTLLGLTGLAAFAVAFGWLGRVRPWPVALAGAWVAATAVTLVAARAEQRLPIALALAVLSLAAAWATLPATQAPGPAVGPSVAGRMVVTLVLVAALSAAAGRVGAFAGGILAALPVLGSVLSVATLRAGGPDAAVGLLRGMLAGMGSFVAFCAVVALVAAGSVGAAFGLALVAAVSAQALAYRVTRPTMATASCGVPST